MMLAGQMDNGGGHIRVMAGQMDSSWTCIRMTMVGNMDDG